MKKILNKVKQIRLGYKLYQLQKQYNHAVSCGDSEKQHDYAFYIEEVQEELRYITINY